VAPTLNRADYDGNYPVPKLVWTDEELADYSCLYSEVVSRKVSDAMEHYSLHWFVDEDYCHAVVLYRLGGASRYDLLIDLKLDEIQVKAPGYEGRSARQVIGVDGTPGIKMRMANQGFAKALYGLVAKHMDALIVSDNEQHEPGAELWRSMAMEEDAPVPLKVVVYDTKLKAVLRDCKEHGFQYVHGDPVQYDGENIPDNHIWGHDKATVLLVADPAKNS